jgi:hypothetical protein
MKYRKTIITVIGGGNSSITLISLLSSAGHKVNLLTRQPERWSSNVTMELLYPDGALKAVLPGHINKISSNPEVVIPESEIIILSLPVSKYRVVLHNIAPFIKKNKKTYIGTIYGQGGFNWMVNEIVLKYQLENVVYFASGLIPWITRLKEYGKVGLNYGSKTVNVVAVFPSEEYVEINNLLLNDLCFRFFGVGSYVKAENFISLTLSVDNQIIHLSRLFGLYERFGGIWKTQAEVPFFYRDYDDLSAHLLEQLDEDYTKIRSEIKRLYPNQSFNYMLNYLDLERLSYNSSNANIKESFTNSKTLNQIATPVIQNEAGLWIFDKNHRFFTDDLYYGLAIARWIGQKLALDTPIIDRILRWAQHVVNNTVLDENGIVEVDRSSNPDFKHGIPSTYGFSSIADIME